MRADGPVATATRTGAGTATKSWLVVMVMGSMALGCSGQLDYEPEEYQVGGASTVGPSPGPATPPASTMTPPAAPPPAGPSTSQPPAGSPSTTPVTPPAGGTTTPPATPPATPPPVAGCAPGLDGLAILAQKCGACHGERAPTKALDLVSPGVGKRLVNVKSGCMNLPLLPSSGSAEDSYFIKKLDAAVPGCGERMPFSATPLTPEERSCLVDWSDKAMARESGR